MYANPAKSRKYKTKLTALTKYQSTLAFGGPEWLEIEEIKNKIRITWAEARIQSDPEALTYK